MYNSLHYKLRAAHVNCQKTILKHVRSMTELKPGEPKILEFLMEYQPCEQKQIAAGCDLDPSSVTGILKRMEQRGLIQREAADGNRRSLYVSLTAYGKEMEARVEQAFAAADRRAVQGLTEAECRELERLLEHVNRNLLEEQKNGETNH